MNKIGLLLDFIKSKSSDLVFLTETWLKPDIIDSIFSPPGYCVLRTDRLSFKGGGVLVLYKSNLDVQEVTAACESFLLLRTKVDFLCIDVLFGKKNAARFLCLYVPPSCSCQIDIIYKTCDLISFFTSSVSPIYILGDFNLP